jgi:hypothetical protein
MINRDENTINIGSFSLTILYSLITSMRGRINNDKNTKNLYIALVSHITEFKNYYMKTFKKTFLDDTIFKEFIVKCIGVPITPEHEKQLLIESRKKQNKKYIFSYDPAESTKTDLNYVFANSSGNPINNIKNLKLQKSDGDDKDLDDDDDFDDDTSNVSIN